MLIMETTMSVTEKVKQIKRSFRLYMNGVTAASMRNKGIDYKVNWGVSQTDLRTIAAMYGSDADLAQALWAEANVRECRILAALIMPPGSMSVDAAMRWCKDIDGNAELMETVVFNLFCRVPHADVLAIRMLGDDKLHLGAYNLICRLLKQHVLLADNVYEELFAKAAADVKSSNRQLLHALVNCLSYVATTDTPHALTADRMLSDAGF